ncbi:MAG: hypothetical protein WCY33_02750 [Clostridia bacterium]|jgi:hypothetical protein
MSAEKAMNEIPEMVKCLLKKDVYSKDYSISNACKEIAEESNGFFVPVRIQEAAHEMLLYAQRADALQEACFNLGDKGQVYRDVKAMMLAHVYLLMGCYEALSEDDYENTKEEIRFQIEECRGNLGTNIYLHGYATDETEED